MAEELSPENKKKAGNGLSVVNICLSVPMLVLGIKSFGACHAEPMIPIYLIGMTFKKYTVIALLGYYLLMYFFVKIVHGKVA